ncbi:Alpha/Beta hydrolase protein [Ochromonadaceae sp. CCMP2298]|nr:Alpha/Beta hydrolase protein [Ochromonadaceae sp. CCMP2298]
MMLQQERLEEVYGSKQPLRKDAFCSEPVSKGKVEFPESLAGRAGVDFDMYSGYVPISDSPDYLFYWFFGAQDANASAPLIIWTNGGPGCSAMEGATTETGPLSLFDIKESCSNDGNCDYTGQLSRNPYAWNVHANMLFLDQPKNVGYSFGYGKETESSVEAADDFIVFYQGWLELFPEFKGRELIIAGESYGGHYVPAWANAILNFNEDLQKKEEGAGVPINFAGVAIGNGCVNNTVQNTEQFVKFQHECHLIPEDANPRTQAAAYASMISHLGYEPNYYDYRVESITCDACYGYNYTAWSYWFLQTEVLDTLHICGDAGNDAFAGRAGGCISMGAFDAHDTFDYSGAVARTLEAGVPVTFYFGKTDTACNYVGGNAMAETIEWTGRERFNMAQFEPLLISGVEAGQVRTSGGLTVVQVDSAGHMVPMDQPAGSAAAIKTILDQL